MNQTLILFDIDATLLSTRGAGMRAMEAAGKALFGESCRADGVQFAGRLDPLIMRDMLSNAGLPASRENLEAFREAYVRNMEELFRNPGLGVLMPGIQELMTRLDALSGVTLGLLTGNFEKTGLLKIRSAGLTTDRFEVAAWGDDSAHDPPERKHLPPIAVERYRKKKGGDPRRVVIVGDTPHDIACARAHGHVAFGVATGKFTSAEVRASGADHVMENLSFTEEAAQRMVHG
ncbi:MAG: HAD hydrolase-like protein [Phycisphaerales bacterium]|nr:HAD hydrolase-like protein [Planctomycetota bacterium]